MGMTDLIEWVEIDGVLPLRWRPHFRCFKNLRIYSKCKASLACSLRSSCFKDLSVQTHSISKSTHSKPTFSDFVPQIAFKGS